MIDKDKTYSLSELRDLRLKMQNQLQYVDNLIKAMVGETSPQVSWTRSALDCIKRKDQFVQTADIISCMFGDTLKDQPNKRNQYVTALSIALNNLCDNEQLIKKSCIGIRGNFYGLPEWGNSELYEARLKSKIYQMTGQQNFVTE